MAQSFVTSRLCDLRMHRRATYQRASRWHLTECTVRFAVAQFGVPRKLFFYLILSVSDLLFLLNHAAASTQHRTQHLYWPLTSPFGITASCPPPKTLAMLRCITQARAFRIQWPVLGRTCPHCGCRHCGLGHRVGSHQGASASSEMHRHESRRTTDRGGRAGISTVTFSRDPAQHGVRPPFTKPPGPRALTVPSPR
jgi:hypothetical protein